MSESLLPGLRKELLDAYSVAHGPRRFVSGVTYIPASCKVYGFEEVSELVSAALEFGLTAGRYCESFETGLAAYTGVARALAVNSGSSANMLAVAGLMSRRLKDMCLVPGDKVVTTALNFPTTVNPLIQLGLRPVLVDSDVGTYNVNVDALAGALEEGARAVMLSHTLGNPFDLDGVSRLIAAHGAYLIEDCCDALGSRFRGAHVGSSSDLATLSFYPAHHITTGEGGAVLVSDHVLGRIVASLRDWGRDCWCPPGKDDTCGRRFDWQLGDLPMGYDHKYTYSEVGYNLKMTDLQASVGVAQIERLPVFVERRRANFNALLAGLKKYEGLLVMPIWSPLAEPSWFGFPLTVGPDAPFDRLELVRFLENRQIGTRMIFGGNIKRQPAYMHLGLSQVGPLSGADVVTERSFWIGVHPAITAEMLSYMLEMFGVFMESKGVSNG